MAKRNISRCSIPVKNGKDTLLIKLKNSNEKDSRTFKLNAYNKDSDTQESLPIYLDNKPTNADTLGPGSEKIYSIDAKNVKRKVVFEVIQETGGSGISVSTKSKGPSSVEISLK